LERDETPIKFYSKDGIKTFKKSYSREVLGFLGIVQLGRNHPLPLDPKTMKHAGLKPPTYGL